MILYEAKYSSFPNLRRKLSTVTDWSNQDTAEDLTQYMSKFQETKWLETRLEQKRCKRQREREREREREKGRDKQDRKPYSNKTGLRVSV